jgi:hypothetical protein
MMPDPPTDREMTIGEAAYAAASAPSLLLRSARPCSEEYRAAYRATQGVWRLIREIELLTEELGRRAVSVPPTETPKRTVPRRIPEVELATEETKRKQVKTESTDGPDGTRGRTA